jgi:prepilin-type N-terminal cleavage/methylation domain-containing protein
MKNKKGFTLFELLVSISIIAVMTAVAVVSFGGVSKKSRDTKRMADVEKIRLALEAAKQIGNVYPVSAGSTANLTTYLQQWPKDPKTGTYYSYNRLTNYTYEICATVEDLGSTNNSTAGCNYKVTNP